MFKFCIFVKINLKMENNSNQEVAESIRKLMQAGKFGKARIEESKP